MSLLIRKSLSVVLTVSYDFCYENSVSFFNTSISSGRECVIGALWYLNRERDWYKSVCRRKIVGTIFEDDTYIEIIVTTKRQND